MESVELGLVSSWIFLVWAILVGMFACKHYDPSKSRVKWFFIIVGGPAWWIVGFLNFIWYFIDKWVGFIVKKLSS
jgi:hypothetical protein